MQEKIEAIIFLGTKIFTVIGLLTSTTIASIVSLSPEQMEGLKTGDAQTVMAIMLGLLVLALLGLCAVIARLFKTNEKRHAQAHKERDKREDAFHDLSECMIKAVAESNESRRDTNEILKRFETKISQCHDETLLIKTGHVKISKEG